MGFSTLMNFVGMPGQIRVMVLSDAEGGVVRIQTFHAICDNMLTYEVFLTCNKHCEEILARFFAYKAEAHVGGFASGWKCCIMWF